MVLVWFKLPLPSRWGKIQELPNITFSGKQGYSIQSFAKDAIDGDLTVALESLTSLRRLSFLSSVERLLLGHVFEQQLR
jgi:hypothetical protein